MKKKLLATLLILFVSSLAISFSVFAASADETYTDTINEYYQPNEFTGIWEQSVDDTVAGSVLKVKTPAANIGNGAIVSTNFGKLAAADYELNFEMKVPQAGDQGAGYFYSCGNPITHPGIGLNFITFRAAITVTKLSGETSPWNVGAYLDGKAPTPGSWIKVSVTVDDGTMKVNAKNDADESIIAEIVINNVTYDESFTQGFLVNDCTNTDNTGFRNISYSAGEKTFTSYPFDPDYVEPQAEVEEQFVPVLDNNILTMSGFGSWEQTSKELKALVGNPSLGNRALIYSNFGGEYTEDFEISFETTVPVDANETDNGMYFRAPDLIEGFYSGVLIRVSYKTLQIVYSTEPDETGNSLRVAQHAFTENSVTTGSYIRVKVISDGTTVTADATQPGSEESILAEGAITIETTCPYTIEGKETYAGFYADKAFPAKFKNIVMTGDGPAADFTAYPFGKTVADTYKISAPGAVNLEGTKAAEDGVVLSDENRENLNVDMNRGYNDVELIGLFTRVFYFYYDGTVKTVNVTTTSGGALPEGYSMKIYNGAYLLLFDGRTNAGRDGLKVVVYDETGYVVFMEDFVFHTIKLKAEISGVTAVAREYDGTRSVDLTGGTLSGILEGDSEEVSFDLGLGMMESSDIGEDKPVSTSIALTGNKSGNYYILQPEGITADITKGTQEAPYPPELESKTSTSVTLIADEVYEYSKDGENWQTSNVFEGLNADTEYTFYCRIMEDENQNASPASEGLKVRTDADGSTSGKDNGNDSGKGCLGNISASFGIFAVASLIGAFIVKRRKND